MKIFLALSLVFLFSVNNFERQKEFNGKYKILYSKHFKHFQSENLFLIVKDSLFYKIIDQDTIIGKVRYIEDNKDIWAYLVDDKEVIVATALDSLIYKSFGKSMMEIKLFNRDTLKFRTTRVRNLHVTINEGLLFRNK